jgi:hypothetical protein
VRALTARRPCTADADRGAALIVAIAFVVMIGTIGAGLAGLITSSSNNRVSLQTLRNREYAAEGAIEESIATVRGLDRSTSAACAATGTTTSTINGIDVRVDWQGACTVVRGVSGAVVAQRNFIFAACVDQGSACTDADAIVRTQVNFRDDPTGTVDASFIQSWSVNG